MMELGATVCLPRRPRCEVCPASADCKGRSRPEHWSAGKARRASVRTIVEMALVEQEGSVLLIRNPPGGLLGGLLELPHAGLRRGRSPRQTLPDRYRGTLRIEPAALTTIRHTVTCHRIEATIFRANLLRPPSGGAAFHLRGDLRQLPLGGLTRKALRKIGIAFD
jgi:A/G-specific adenine glycosylase